MAHFRTTFLGRTASFHWANKSFFFEKTSKLIEIIFFPSESIFDLFKFLTNLFFVVLGKTAYSMSHNVRKTIGPKVCHSRSQGVNIIAKITVRCLI